MRTLKAILHLGKWMWPDTTRRALAWHMDGTCSIFQTAARDRRDEIETNIVVVVKTGRQGRRAAPNPCALVYPSRGAVSVDTMKRTAIAENRSIRN